MNILLLVTGSIACIKHKELYESLSKLGEVKIVMSKAAEKILAASNIEALPHFNDDDEGWGWENIKHINLRNWADMIVIAPCSMNTLAKIANGISDSLITDIVRAWDIARPMFIAPAANTLMYQNGMTAKHIKSIVKYYNGIFIDPIYGKLACGEEGIGKMAHTLDIIALIKTHTTLSRPLIYSNIKDRCDIVVPVGNHPGAFGYKRSYYYHPGVDLYCADNTCVRACETGRVVANLKFTGPPEHPHWEETHAIVIRGTRTIVYGELSKNFIMPGTIISKDSNIGYVKRVIPKKKARPDIPFHSCSMLHFEMYSRWTGDFADWKNEKPDFLLDPTEELVNIYKRKVNEQGRIETCV